MRTPVLACFLAATAAAQTQWRPLDGVAFHAMAYHAASQQLVRFGGESVDGTLRGRTWLAPPGGAWVEANPGASPAPRKDHGLVDAGPLGVAFLFGGQGDNALLDDLWAWDGTHWNTLSLLPAPSPRAGHAMAFDAARQRVVLFGGETATGDSAETWEFDGTRWHQMHPTNSPPATRAPGAMAFNPATQRVTLFRGTDRVWEWDGQAWRSFLPANQPSPNLQFFGQKLVTDPSGAGVLLVGGEELSWGTVVRGAYHRWDGVDWAPMPVPIAEPTQRYDHAVAASPTQVFVHGGVEREEDTFFRSSSTFVWSGGQWTDLGTEPRGRLEPRLAYDDARGELIMVGGRRGFFPVRETWLRRGRVWSLGGGGPTASVPAAWDLGLAYDAGRQVVVAFGGCSFTVFGNCESTSDETWEWDGAQWTQQLPSVRPPARSRPSMAYDGARQATVMFGGVSQAGVVLDDTWTWDGATWTQLASTFRPPQGPMAFDEAAGLVYLAGPGYLWVLGGSSWFQSSALPSASPVALTYDRRRARLVLIDRLTGTWERTETGTWLQREGRGFGDAAAYDPQIGAVVAFGPGGGLEFGPSHLGRWTPQGAGCSGPNGTPELVPLRDPWVGQNCNLAVTNAPGSVLGCIGFGTSSWNGLPLPLDLAGYGMPGCALHQDVARIDLLGSGTWSVLIPPRPNLVGIDVQFQAMVIDPAANAAGAVVSNALTATLGGL